MSDQNLIRSMFPSVVWTDDERGFIECPGKHVHTGKTSRRDCKIHINGAATIYCFHTSCESFVQEANYKMRRALWDKKEPLKRELTPEEKAKIRQDMQKKRHEEGLRKWAKDHFEKILEKHSWPIADVWDQSPFKSEKEEYDQRLFLSMFDMEDILWMGEPIDSGDGKEKHFRDAFDWGLEKIKTHFTCPCTFKPGTTSRSNEAVLTRPYLVIESDTMTQDQTCSLFKWLSGFMKLKAIVYTGGKSMHGWFRFPSNELFEKLKIMLPEMQCDRALFKPSQPVRLPGVMRGEKWQSFYYFNHKI